MVAACTQVLGLQLGESNVEETPLSLRRPPLQLLLPQLLPPPKPVTPFLKVLLAAAE